MILLSRSEEIVLLAIWKLGDNAYGVTIRDLISEETGHDWSFGAVYKPLKQLSHKHYVEKTRSEPSADRGGRSKFLYTITSKGEEALRNMRKVYKAVWTNESKITFD